MAMTDGDVPAVILGMSETGLSAMRLLGRRGIDCWGVGSEDAVAVFASRYCRHAVRLPAGTSDAHLLDLLREVAREVAVKAALIPTSDRYVAFLSANREKLADRFRFSLPDHEVVLDMLNKERFAERAREAGFPIPKTLHVTYPEQLQEAARELGYPLVVKPCGPDNRARGTVPKVAILASADEVAEFIARLGDGGGVGLLAQEMIAGPDASHISIAVCCGSDSKPVAVFTARKKRQTNVGAGVGTYVERAEEPECALLACRLLEAMRYVGVAEVEIKRDAAAGRDVLIEVNPRLWVQTALPFACGLDFAFMQYELALGRKPAEQALRPGPAAWQDMIDDFYWSFRRGGYRDEGLVTLFGWLGDTFRARADAYASWRDPSPFLVRLWEALAAFARGRRRRRAP